MAVPNMIVTLAMNATKYSRGLKTAAKDTSSFGQFTTRAFNLAKGALAGLTLSTLRFIPTLAQMGTESRKADIQLKFMLENMQGISTATNQTIKAMAKYADRVSMATGIDDEQIKAVQRKLLVFKSLRKTAGDLGGTFERTTQAAIDLAAGGFGEMESNAIKLGRMLENPTKNLNALNRAGITFTETEKRKIAALQESGDLLGAQDIVLKSVEKRVRGLAVASSTPFERMNQQFQQIGDTIGEAMLPSLEKMNTDISKWLSSPQGKRDIRDLVEGFKALAEFLKVTLQLLRSVLSTIKQVVRWSKELAKINPKWSSSDTAVPGPPIKGGSTSDPTGLKGAFGAPVINFNVPVDSVSAGREVKRVLDDYARANGGR